MLRVEPRSVPRTMDLRLATFAIEQEEWRSTFAAIESIDRKNLLHTSGMESVEPARERESERGRYALPFVV